MSFDNIQSKFICRTSVEELEDDLNPFLFEPSLLAWKKMLKSKNIQGKISEIASVTPGFAFPSSAFVEDSKNPVVKIADLDDQPINNLKTGIDTPFNFPNKYHIAGESVLFAMTGATVGKVGYLPVERSCWINQRVASIKGKSTDCGYLFALMVTQKIRQQVVAYASGTAQPNISDSQINNITVPKIDAAAQKYIGDKVRQAEQLRAWAKKLESEFDTSLKKAVPEAFENKSTGRKYSRALTQEITYTLNPGAFDEERLRVQRYLLNLGGQRFRILAEIIGPTTNNYKPENTYIGLDAIASGNSQLSPSTVEQAEIAGTCRLLTEGPIIAKLRPYLNKVSYIPKRLAGAVGSTELLCVSPIGGNSGWYIYGILKSELTLKQLRPLATGATHPRIDQYDVYDLVVPVLDNQDSLGHLLEQAQEAYFLSTELTSASKFLVEALIEGQLSEDDLIAAEQALQAGNDQLDRQILNRLKTDGIDGQGQALFSDLDQLYSLLEQASHS